MGTSAMRQSSGPSSEKLAWSTYLFGRGRPRAPPADPWERWRAGAAPIRARDARTAVCAIFWGPTVPSSAQKKSGVHACGRHFGVDETGEVL